MKEILVREYKNARFRFINEDNIIVESDDFRCAYDNELLPFLVKFDKEKVCWVHVKTKNFEYSPFANGVPVSDPLNIQLFEEKIWYLKEINKLSNSNEEEDSLILEDNEKVQNIEL